MVTRYIKDAFIYGAGDSIVGQVRKANEDNCGYRKTVNGELFVVCDGMGGHVGGATASRIAVDSILNYIGQQFNSDKRVVLSEALKFANTQILGAAAQDPSLKGMGTTACIALVDAQNIWIAHVGDSRIYLYSEQEKYLYRITKDHSLVQGLVDRGELDDREAEHHPQKNIILRALGTKPDVEPDVDQSPVRAQVGDTLLICSDGLSGMIDDNQIEAILREDRSLEDKVQKLIDNANTPDKGKDNITVQLIQIQSSLDNVSAHPNFNPKWRLAHGSISTSPTPPVSSGSVKVTPPTSNKHPNTLHIILFSILGVLACAISVVVIIFICSSETAEQTTRQELDPGVGIVKQQRSDVENEAEDAASNSLKEAEAEAEAEKAKAEAEKAKAEAEKAKAEAKIAEAEKAKAEAKIAEAEKAKAEAKKAEAATDTTVNVNANDRVKTKAEETLPETDDGTVNVGTEVADTKEVIEKEWTKENKELEMKDIFKTLPKDYYDKYEWSSSEKKVAIITDNANKKTRGVKKVKAGKVDIIGKDKKTKQEQFRASITILN